MTFPRLPNRSDDRGSLVMASLFITISVGMTTLLAGIVVAHIRSTRDQVHRVRALHAAQAGLDTALARIRAADDGAGNGVKSELPCGPISGGVGGGTTEQFTVNIYYVGADPRTRMTGDQSWFAAAPNHLSCAPGSGPTVIPLWAVLYSTGSDGTSTRVLHGAHRLRTTNQTILGGQVHMFYTATSTRDLCMDAVDMATVTTGTRLQMRDCDTTGSRAEQNFAYTTASTFLLVSSVTAARPLGLCLDGGPTPHVQGAFVVFQPCQSPAPLRQQWLMTGALIEGAASSTTTDGYAMQLGASNTPGFLTLTNTPLPGVTYNNRDNFAPDAAVGPGDAGPHNGQLVNFNQFSRCLDLNGGNYQLGYLIAWQCKPSWNQSFVLPTLSTSPFSAVAGKIVMNVVVGTDTTPVGMYCLRSPRTTASGNYPALVPCTNASAAANLQWRAYGNTGDYATSYRILDVDGNCLHAADLDSNPPDVDVYGPLRVARILLRTCSATTLQKWNADPNIMNGLPLKYVGER